MPLFAIKAESVDKRAEGSRVVFHRTLKISREKCTRANYFRCLLRDYHRGAALSPCKVESLFRTWVSFTALCIRRKFVTKLVKNVDFIAIGDFNLHPKQGKVQVALCPVEQLFPACKV